MASDGWEIIPLSEIADLRTGKLDSNAAVERGRYPFFTCSPETLRIDHCAFDCEAALLAGNNANGVFPVKYYHGKFNAYQRTYVITSKDRLKLNTKYLYYQLHLLRQRLGDYSIGTATKFLTHTILNPLPIPVPPLPEQDAIANILGVLDDKIELNRRMNETLEGLARAIFQSWFVDFDPVRAQRDGLPPPALSPATAALFPDSFEDSTLGKIPKGWRVGVLEDVLSVIETGSRPKGGVGGISFGVPSIGAESIVGLGKFNFGKTKYVPVEFFEAMRKGHVESRDVLLYKDGGRPGEYEPHVAMFGDGFPFERSCINEHVYRLRANERLSQTLLYFWLTSEVALDEMRRKGTGVAIPGLNSTAVKSLTTLIPSREVVASFNQAAESFVGRILSNCNESRNLAATRDALLPKLLSGEIRVAEAERLVEDAG
ncbi:MAG: restriction endonuclease subunit S [Planctomycetia bacterium]|nr:restriction endonuclease subunit S [Planctomycetia bacterium]